MLEVRQSDFLDVEQEFRIVRKLAFEAEWLEIRIELENAILRTARDIKSSGISERHSRGIFHLDAFYWFQHEVSCRLGIMRGHHLIPSAHVQISVVGQNMNRGFHRVALSQIFT